MTTGMTPLHLVAKKGDVDLLTDFLLACPESIKDVNVNGETILHITIMNDKYEQLKVLTGWMQKMRDSDDVFIDVLNRRDRGGNTVLHLAAYENNDKVCTFSFIFFVFYSQSFKFGLNFFVLSSIRCLNG